MKKPRNKLEAVASTSIPRHERSPTRILRTYNELRSDIIRGRYAPGEQMRVEHLKDEYDVSGGTLREALLRLVSDSLVVPSERRGFSIAPMSLEDVADLTRTRILLESEALRESILVGDDNWESLVVSSFYKLSLSEKRLQTDPAGAFPEWEQRNEEFHRALVSACTSDWVLRLRMKLYHLSERYRWLSAVKGPPPDSVHDEHEQIYEAALNRDDDRAVEALRVHINRSLSIIQEQGLLFQTT